MEQIIALVPRLTGGARSLFGDNPYATLALCGVIGFALARNPAHGGQILGTLLTLFEKSGEKPDA